MFLMKGTNMTQIQRFLQKFEAVGASAQYSHHYWIMKQNREIFRRYFQCRPCIALLLAGPGGIICFSTSVLGEKEMLQNLSGPAPLLFIGYYNTISVFTSSNIEPCYALITSHLTHRISLLFPD